MSTNKNNIEVKPNEITPDIAQDVYVNGKYMGSVYCAESPFTATAPDVELNWELNDEIYEIIGYAAGPCKVSDLVKVLQLHYDRN